MSVETLDKIEALFFSEFDNDLGPQIAFEYPKNSVTPNVFDSFSEYIITKPQLFGRLISLRAHGKKIVGYPVNISDEKYPRNALLFNLAFVFAEDADSTPYNAAILKTARILKDLEEESEFIYNPSTKENIPKLLETMYNALNSTGTCSITIDEANSLNIKVDKMRADPPRVWDHQVPVLLSELRPAVIREWDLTMQQMIPFVNGINCVKRIAWLANADADLVREAVRHLMYYGHVKTIDIFQYSNIYCSTASLVELLRDTDMQEACMECVVVHGTPRPPFAAIFKLYAALQPNVTLSEFCDQYPLSTLNIDARLFITFGVLNGFVQRVHKYCIRQSDGKGEFQLPAKDTATLLSMLDGKHSMDAICCELGMSLSAVEELLRLDPYCAVVHR